MNPEAIQKSDGEWYDLGDPGERVVMGEAVKEWRLHQLIEAGYSYDDAAELAPRADVDLHAAIRLVRQGCAPPVAVAILA